RLASVLSRVPAEIWYEILKTTVFTHKVFEIDPYNGNPARFLDPHTSRGRVPYKDFAQLTCRLRLVCTSWNSFVRPFVKALASLWGNIPVDALPNNIQLFREIKEAKVILGHRYPVLCRCDPTFPCPRCAATRPVKIGLHEVFEAEGPILADTMRVMTAEVLDLVIASPQAIPNLRALSLRLDGSDAQRLNHSLTSSDDFAPIFNLLVHLDLDIIHPSLPPWSAPLALPALRSMNLFVSSGIPRFDGWGLGSLKTMSLVGTVASHSTLAWESFPQLLCLRCPARLFTQSLPPKSYPLAYLSFTLVDEDSFTEEIIRELHHILEDRAQHRGTQGEFYWRDVMGHSVYTMTAVDTDTNDDPTPRIWKAIRDMAQNLENKVQNFLDDTGFSYTAAVNLFEEVSPAW
ncbi:hypothetical protein M408DRAFT_329728, partial [Serendipita vermifera MAFF 305830]